MSHSPEPGTIAPVFIYYFLFYIIFCLDHSGVWTGVEAGLHSNPRKCGSYWKEESIQQIRSVNHSRVISNRLSIHCARGLSFHYSANKQQQQPRYLYFSFNFFSTPLPSSYSSPFPPVFLLKLPTGTLASVLILKNQPRVQPKKAGTFRIYTNEQPTSWTLLPNKLTKGL